jgi:hypothetical protein
MLALAAVDENNPRTHQQGDTIVKQHKIKPTNDSERSIRSGNYLLHTHLYLHVL